jgi:LPXTG-site transpeptidase (sortase) family protein
MGFRHLRLLVLSCALLFASPAFADDWAGEQTSETEVAPAQTTEEPAGSSETFLERVAPVVLKIPAIGVDADIFPVGEAADGAMDVPPTPDSVAWWSLGYGTGEPGNIVLAAHVDWGGQLRVFGLLHTLSAGSRVTVVDTQLREFNYEVISSHSVRAEGAAVEEIFAANGGSELTLITCGGQFDSASRQYLDRLIVKARQV